MIPPTIAQQNGMAYAHIPFAVISCFSSGYVIFRLLCIERHKLKRLYHRLVLAMNFASLPLAIVWVWRPFAVPEGTPYYAGASGTIETCTASGFLFAFLMIPVPIYYASLSLQAFVGMKNNFKEEKYRWIEKYIHIVAWGISFVIATIVAATENFNPRGAGCYITRYPVECEIDPDVPCERGKNIKLAQFIVGLSLIFVYFIFTPSVLIMMYCWIGKAKKKMHGCQGLQRIRETARNEMMQKVASQISVYFFSFLSTWVSILIHTVYHMLTGELQYNLLIFAQCVNALQGFVFAIVYFSLPRLGKPKSNDCVHCNPQPVDCVHCNPQPSKHAITVQEIRSNADKKLEVSTERAVDDVAESYVFNIFDGAPDENSPWAKYIDNDDDSCSDSEDNQEYCENA